MKKMFLLLALVLPLGCQNKSEPPAIAASAGGSSETSGAPATVKSALVDRVWTRSYATELPGIMRIFLANGTLVIDSCWETYRLSEWQMESDSTMLWNEDGMDIRADVVSVDASGLVLRLRLTQGTEEQHYAHASVPFVCPDMPR